MNEQIDHNSDVDSNTPLYHLERSHPKSEAADHDALMRLEIETPENVNLDRAPDLVGGFGTFQMLILIIIPLASTLEQIQNLSIVFVAKDTQWTCAKNSTICNFTGEISSANDSYCSIPIGEWTFIEPDVSIISQFRLDCTFQWMQQLPPSVFHSGSIIGLFVLGWLSDRFGRKKVMIPAYTLTLTIGLIGCISPNFEFLLVCNFISGFCVPALLSSMTVLTSEIVAPKYRAKCLCVVSLAWPLITCLFGLMAYSIRKWRLLMLSVQVPFCVACGALFFVPESLQWLLENDRKKIQDVLSRIAYWNKMPIPNCIVVPRNLDRTSRRTSPLYLFNTWKMARKSIIIGFAWITLHIVSYAVILDSQNLGFKSLYVNFVCLSLVEIPGILIPYYTLDRLGRKKSTLFSSLICVVAFGALALLPENDSTEIARLISAMVTRLFSLVAYCSMVTWTIESYPTFVRSQGIGFAFAMAKIGLLSTPWVLQSSKTLHPAAPKLLFLVLLLIQCGLFVLLPETNGNNLESQT